MLQGCCCIPGEPDREWRKQPTFRPQLQCSKEWFFRGGYQKRARAGPPAYRSSMLVLPSSNLLHNCLDCLEAISRPMRSCQRCPKAFFFLTHNRFQNFKWMNCRNYTAGTTPLHELSRRDEGQEEKYWRARRTGVSKSEDYVTTFWHGLGGVVKNRLHISWTGGHFTYIAVWLGETSKMDGDLLEFCHHI